MNVMQALEDLLCLFVNETEAHGVTGGFHRAPVGRPPASGADPEAGVLDFIGHRNPAAAPQRGQGANPPVLLY